jgi:hypothetical protein
MGEATGAGHPSLRRRFPLLAVAALVVGVFGCSIWANLSFAVTNREKFRFIPPFRRNENWNGNHHLGGEYYHIARSLAGGEGFANPFPARTGPTAWMPPVLPALMAAVLWATGGDREALMAAMVFLQVYALLLTGLLVLALAWQTMRRGSVWLALGIFLAALLADFHLCFQLTHDSGIMLLALDLVVAGFCWLQPLGGRWAAAAWGALGGLCALVNPIVGAVWGALSLVPAARQRAWRRLGVALLVAGLVLAPWTVRNYLVLGRLVPVKSNLAYELYQSQCLQPDGLIQLTTFSTHPNATLGVERIEYKAVGEMAFLDHKRRQFWEAVRADPQEFVDRVACRFLGVTLWYVPFNRTHVLERPVVLWLSRALYPLPFLALLLLAGTAPWRPLERAQWSAIAVYALYLLPYVAASYYERYGLPLLGVKVLLVVWAVDHLLGLWPPKRTRGDGEIVVSAGAGRPLDNRRAPCGASV